MKKVQNAKRNYLREIVQNKRKNDKNYNVIYNEKGNQNN